LKNYDKTGDILYFGGGCYYLSR